jgi:hypothetical protein
MVSLWHGRDASILTFQAHYVLSQLKTSETDLRLKDMYTTLLCTEMIIPRS